MPNYIILRLSVRKLSCWETSKQTPLKTSTSLCYAMLVGNNKQGQLAFEK